MRARARIAVSRDARGGERYDVLRGDGPIAPRVTADGVHLVGQAAGPLGDDDLELDCAVGPGAALRLRSVAASLPLPGPDGGASRFAIGATVAAGGGLDLALEPTIAAAGCDHRAETRVELAEGARLRLREEIVLGRHGERPGRYTGLLHVTYAGRPLLRHALALADDAVTTSPAVPGDARTVGMLLLAGPDVPAPDRRGHDGAWPGPPAPDRRGHDGAGPDLPGPDGPGSGGPGSDGPGSGGPGPDGRRPDLPGGAGPDAGEGVAVTPLAGPAVLVIAVAPDAATLRRRLRCAEASLSPAASPATARPAPG
ncbi:MAG: urease accessory protein UreD [Streptosporangiales bacterium]|nr:urease accessory protein UreD [Streptosporangiales bacterium]